jgi:hypothetical protein
MEQHQNNSKLSLWSGRILKVLVAVFLLFDAVMKIIKHPIYIKGTEELGLPASSVQPLGIYLFLSTVLYIIPRTAVLGGLLLTAYLGGAAAITFAASNGAHPYMFPIVFAAVMWAAEYLKNAKMRSAIPLPK